jgi:hypothetical protein
VAPVDFFSSVGAAFAQEVPEEFESLLPPEIRALHLVFEFHWVSEKGPAEPRKLTCNISLNPTVRSIAACGFPSPESAAS